MPRTTDPYSRPTGELYPLRNAAMLWIALSHMAGDADKQGGHHLEPLAATISSATAMPHGSDERDLLERETPGGMVFFPADGLYAAVCLQPMIAAMLGADDVAWPPLPKTIADGVRHNLFDAVRNDVLHTQPYCRLWVSWMRKVVGEDGVETVMRTPLALDVVLHPTPEVLESIAAMGVPAAAIQDICGIPVINLPPELAQPLRDRLTKRRRPGPRPADPNNPPPDKGAKPRNPRAIKVKPGDKTLPDDLLLADVTDAIARALLFGEAASGAVAQALAAKSPTLYGMVRDRLQALHAEASAQQAQA